MPLGREVLPEIFPSWDILSEHSFQLEHSGIVTEVTWTQVMMVNTSMWSPPNPYKSEIDENVKENDQNSEETETLRKTME